jgi:hypothetical protein
MLLLLMLLLMLLMQQQHQLLLLWCSGPQAVNLGLMHWLLSWQLPGQHHPRQDPTRGAPRPSQAAAASQAGATAAD